MSVKRPTPVQLQEIASSLGMRLSDEHASTYLALPQPNFDAYDLIDWLPDHVPAVTYTRTAGHRPNGEENKYGAWYVKSTIEGAPKGELFGKTAAIKDDVCVAGVLVMNGASTMEGYVPDVDATIVTRLLDAGANIAGKAVCECLFSGGSHTSASGPVHNPRRRGYSAGGWSSGSAALVAAGEVDLAIGGDQGGSIRMPVAYCGFYGMTPPPRLVPYTGIMPIEVTLDHTSPITANVADNVDAQGSGRPRRPRPASARRPRSAAVHRVDEGRSERPADRHRHRHRRLWLGQLDARRRCAGAQGSGRFTELGARVSEVSVPMHRMGFAIWLPVAAESATQQMMKDNGHGSNWNNLYVISMIEWHADWKARADEVSEPLKLTMVLGEYFIRHCHGRFYAKAQNLTRQLTQAYDDAFKDFDLLLLPTVPLTATKLPAAGASVEDNAGRALEMLANTPPFDSTGHPAMSLPCGLLDGLPVGMLLVGERYEEGTIYRGAYASEQAGDWHSI